MRSAIRVIPFVFLGFLALGLAAFRVAPSAPQLFVWGLGALLLGSALWWAVATLGSNEAELDRMKRELAALHEAELAVAADLSLETVLGTVVDQARGLLGTRYGALSVVDDRARITSFITSGIDDHTAEQIGPAPQGRGLLGVVLRDGQSLRIDHIDDDPRSVGFPDHHPFLRDLLAVPIVCRGPHRGNLYVSTKANGRRFTSSDEHTLSRFAQHAATAIDNAHLVHQVHDLATARERRHIAHEIHDRVAQALASVITRSQVVETHLQNDRRDEALRQLDRLETTARESYEDVRSQILDYRTSTTPDLDLLEVLGRYLDQWSEQTGIPVDRRLPLSVRIPRGAEVQLLRIVQEALTNVRRHAEAEEVLVSLESDEGGVTAVVRDDGRGFRPDDPSRAGGPRFGLATMRERAESLGGHLTVESEIGNGTRVTFHLSRHQSTQEEPDRATGHR